MKRMMSSSKKWFVMLMAAVASLGFQSCLDDDDDKYAMLLPNALVTVKNASDNSCYLQLDERTTLLPVNMKSSPFGGKEVRALVNYSNVDEPSGAYSQAVYVNWIDSLLTKPMAPNLGEAENDEVYGDDPVEMVADWVTIAEDGYLTLRFRTMWGNPSQKHFVNLISTNNPEDPYEVEFRHNAYGDTYGQAGDGWHSFTGKKSVQFDYCTRQSSLPAQPGMTSVRSSLNMK